MPSQPAFESLPACARNLRCDIISMISEAGSRHPGGSPSIADMIPYLRRVGLRDTFARSGRGYRQPFAHFHIDAAEIVRKAEGVLALKHSLAHDKL